jgi:predicted nucleotidyltransferase
LTVPNSGTIIPNMGTISLADALFTRAQQRVLGVLFGDPGRSFYLQEIVARAGSGTGAVQRELARLEGAGLVTATRIGRQKHFQANRQAPIYEELRGLVLKTAGLADVLREALAPLAAQIIAAFVYGSVAKRQDTARSDVDVLVVSETLGTPDLYDALVDAETRLGRRVSPLVYSRDELSRDIDTGQAFITRVLAQPKIWLIGGEDALAA